MDMLWYIHNAEYYIAMKMNELLQVTSWMNLSVEGRQTQKHTLCIQYIHRLTTGKLNLWC